MVVRVTRPFQSMVAVVIHTYRNADLMDLQGNLLAHIKI
jgi:hypothetical protein